MHVRSAPCSWVLVSRHAPQRSCRCCSSLRHHARPSSHRFRSLWMGRRSSRRLGLCSGLVAAQRSDRVPGRVHRRSAVVGAHRELRARSPGRPAWHRVGGQLVQRASVVLSRRGSHRLRGPGVPAQVDQGGFRPRGRGGGARGGPSARVVPRRDLDRLHGTAPERHLRHLARSRERRPRGAGDPGLLRRATDSVVPGREPHRLRRNHRRRRRRVRGRADRR